MLPFKWISPCRIIKYSINIHLIYVKASSSTKGASWLLLSSKSRYEKRYRYPGGASEDYSIYPYSTRVAIEDSRQAFRHTPGILSRVNKRPSGRTWPVRTKTRPKTFRPIVTIGCCMSFKWHLQMSIHNIYFSPRWIFTHLT